MFQLTGADGSIVGTYDLNTPAGHKQLTTDQANNLNATLNEVGTPTSPRALQWKNVVLDDGTILGSVDVSQGQAQVVQLLADKGHSPDVGYSLVQLPSGAPESFEPTNVRLMNEHDMGLFETAAEEAVKATGIISSLRFTDDMLEAARRGTGFQSGPMGNFRLFWSNAANFLGLTEIENALGTAKTGEAMISATNQLALGGAEALSRVTNLSIGLLREVYPTLFRSLEGNQLISDILKFEAQDTIRKDLLGNWYQNEFAGQLMPLRPIDTPMTTEHHKFLRQQGMAIPDDWIGEQIPPWATLVNMPNFTFDAAREKIRADILGIAENPPPEIPNIFAQAAQGIIGREGPRPEVDLDGAAMLGAGRTLDEVQAAIDERKALGEPFVFSTIVTDANGQRVIRITQWAPQAAAGSFEALYGAGAGVN
jgi:hypothetical protein